MKPSERWGIQSSIWIVGLFLSVIVHSPGSTQAMLAGIALTAGVTFWGILLAIAYFHER